MGEGAEDDDDGDYEVNGKAWNSAHTALLKSLAGYAYDHEIAKLTGHCVDTVQRRRSMLGLPPYRGTTMRYGSWDDIRAPLRHGVAA